MTRSELLVRLEAAAFMDEESGHADADRALVEYINDPGITAAYEALHKWYA